MTKLNENLFANITRTWENFDGSTVEVHLAVYEGNSYSRTEEKAVVTQQVDAVDLTNLIGQGTKLGDGITLIALRKTGRDRPLIWPRIGARSTIGDNVTLKYDVCLQTGVVVGVNSTILGGSESNIETKQVIGQLSVIGKNAWVRGSFGEKCSIGNGTRICVYTTNEVPARSSFGDNSRITYLGITGKKRRVQIGNNCYIGRYVHLDGTVVGDGVTIHDTRYGTPIGSAVIGDNVTIDGLTEGNLGQWIDDDVVIPAGVHILANRHITRDDVIASFDDGTLHVGHHGSDVLGDIPKGVEEIISAAFSRWQQREEELLKDLKLFKESLESRMRTAEGRFRAEIERIEARLNAACADEHYET